jgi:asparagine N-glycosylation enzyme membrane subunit Stt3
METQIAVIAALILAFTQLITRMFPKVNAMNTTIIVTVVVGVLGFTVSESIDIMTIIIALVSQVFGYDLVTKSIIPTFQKSIIPTVRSWFE